MIAQTRFSANMDFAANLLQIIIQLTLTRWILVHYSAGFLIISSDYYVFLFSHVLTS